MESHVGRNVISGGSVVSLLRTFFLGALLGILLLVPGSSSAFEEYDDLSLLGSTSTSSLSSSPSLRDETTYFISDSLIRLNGTSIRIQSEREPLEIQFKTICRAGYLVHQDGGLTVRLSSDGKLHYSSRPSQPLLSFPASVDDGEWHSLIFHESLLLLTTNNKSISLPLKNPNSSSEVLELFNGFVGCLRLRPLENGYFRGRSLFKRLSPKPACDDPTVVLSSFSTCPAPQVLGFCSECRRRGGFCQVDSSAITNTDSQFNYDCFCPANETLADRRCGEMLLEVGRGPQSFDLDATLSQQSQREAETDSNSVSSTVMNGSSCLCLNGGVCLENGTTSTGSTVCSCVGTGFYGDRCEIENLLCHSSPCVHGICQTKGNGYQCYCTPGFAGSNCNINFDECLSNPCGDNGICEDGVNSYSCNCRPGFIGNRCETEIDECESSPCEHGGTCLDGVATYSCSCLPGYTGQNCSVDIDDCESSPCFNGGTCNDKINSFSCNCSDTGYEGNQCQTQINECYSYPCLNGGSCEDLLRDFHCSCHSGYEGKECEIDIQDCEEEPCLHNSTCFERSNQSLYNSQSPSSLPSIFLGNFSYSNASGYECLCIPGFTGMNCETNIDDCMGKPCNSGKCIDGINNFTCDCNNGYTGIHCETEINECDPPEGTGNPCVRGTCLDKVGDYACACPEGFGGKNCSVVLVGCVGVSCLNGGTCIPTYFNSTHAHKCLCSPGWAGGICNSSTTLSFSGSKDGSAQILSNESLRSGYGMSFRFRTTLSDVFIAVGESSTYFILTLSGGKLNLQSSLLNLIKGISSGNNLANADWHQAWFAINDSHIILGVNQEQTIHPIQNNEPEQPLDSGFNKTVIGGTTPLLASLTTFPSSISSFVGCIQDITINGKRIVPGETGAHLKYDPTLVQIGCERREQCSPNNETCLNGGTCTDLWTKFNCECPRPFLGERCSYEYVAGTFGHENTSISIVQVNIQPEVGRKFEKSFEISMFVRTRESNGTIFLLQEEPSKNHSLYLKAYVDLNQLGVIAKLDEGEEETYKVGGLSINDGQPHLISFQKERGLVKINVNGQEHFRRSLPLKPTQIFNPEVMYIGGIPMNASRSNSSVHIPSDQSPPESIAVFNARRRRGRSWEEFLQSAAPFKGVIQDVRVNLTTDTSTHPKTSRYTVEFFPLAHVNKSFLMGDPLGEVILHGDVLKGVVSDDSCRVNLCLNDGECEVTWNDFQCNCTEEFDGKICEHRLPCAIVSCPNGSVCRNLFFGGVVKGFQCEGEASFDGKQDPLPSYSLKSENIDNLTFNQVSIRYRTQRPGSILHLLNPSNQGSFRIGIEEVVSGLANESEPHFQVYMNETVRVSERVSNGLDGEWHSFQLIIHSETLNVQLFFDGISLEKKPPTLATFPINYLRDILSQSDSLVLVGGRLKGGERVDLFRGCLGELMIGDLRLPFVSPDELLEVNPDKNTSLLFPTAPSAFYMETLGEKRLGCILCFEEECNHRGVCLHPMENFECSCDEGFSGAYCEVDVDECLGSPCSSGSTCIDGTANFTCLCSPGYMGWKCDIEIDECLDPNPCTSVDKRATCEDKINSYFCHCSEEYVGMNCGKRRIASCGDSPCFHQGTCSNTQLQADGTNYTCSCALGYTGRNCESAIDYCADVTCSDHGKCQNKNGGAECYCEEGWTGPRCEQSVDDCVGSPCLHDGICIDGHRGFSCNCTHTGFSGMHCGEDVNECLFPSLSNCPINSTCNNSNGSFTCVCEEGLCERIWPSFTCGNDGFCEAKCEPGNEPYPTCRCLEPWTGNNCTEKINISSLESTKVNIVLIIIPVLAAFLVSLLIGGIILVRMARKKRATRGVYSPSQQEFSNPRVELDNVLKPPPEERLI